MLYNRETKEYFEQKESIVLVFLYKTFIGRLILKILTKKWISNLVARYMQSPLSKLKIKRFIKKNKINMDDYIDDNYYCFDDFFSRKIKENKRVLKKDSNLLIAPCDGKLSVYKIDENTNLNIKNSNYSIEELLQDKELAKNYHDGYCLIFRLCIDDYHHYSFIDDGKVIKKKNIKGKLHTVRPISHKYKKVFSENSRKYCLLKTSNFGNIIQMEVGALLVGKIVNNDLKKFNRGDEKGYFRFGGSTIILLFEKDKIIVDDDILKFTEDNVEVIVKMFDVIGRRY